MIKTVLRVRSGKRVNQQIDGFWRNKRIVGANADRRRCAVPVSGRNEATQNIGLVTTEYFYSQALPDRGQGIVRHFV